MLKITTLIENNPDDRKRLINEHGLSLLIETGEKQILFDTGQSGDFLKNARALGVRLEELDYVLLSHGHYDHSGGFEALVHHLEQVPGLIVGDEFFRPKFKKISESEYHFNGNSFDEAYLKQKEIPLQKVEGDMLRLTEKIMVFHHFQRSNSFEKQKGNFYIRIGDAYLPDAFEDEIALGIETDKGLAIIVGCSHIGVVNILRTVRERVKRPIYAVIGGTHLVDADERRMQKTIDVLKDMNIQLIALSHCTGEEGILRISRELKEYFIYNNTGNVITI